MKEIIKMLEERGFMDSLKLANKLLPYPEDLSAEDVKRIRAVAAFDLIEDADKDEELVDAFAMVCYDLGREALINELEKIMEDN